MWYGKNHVLALTDFGEVLECDLPPLVPVTISHKLQDIGFLHFKPKGSNGHLVMSHEVQEVTL